MKKSGFNNFIQVFLAALGRPAPILTLALSVGISLLFPVVSTYIIPLGLMAVLAMAWSDTNNPEFIKKTLQANNISQSEINIKTLLQSLDQQYTRSDFEEVRKDMLYARKSLVKIQDILNYLQTQGQSYDSFVFESISKMVTQLVVLSKQEEFARKFLVSVDDIKLKLEVNDLKNKLAKISDEVAKIEYQKVVQTKENQLKLIFDVEKKLERIDSYLARINSALDSTYTYLTKLGLKDEQGMVDESEVLTTSLETIVADIDRFESEMLEVSQQLNNTGTSNKTSGLELRE